MSTSTIPTTSFLVDETSIPVVNNNAGIVVMIDLPNRSEDLLFFLFWLSQMIDGTNDGWSRHEHQNDRLDNVHDVNWDGGDHHHARCAVTQGAKENGSKHHADGMGVADQRQGNAVEAM